MSINNNSTLPLSDMQGELQTIVRALCYAVAISTDDVHKKYLAELVYRVTNNTNIADEINTTDGTIIDTSITL